MIAIIHDTGVSTSELAAAIGQGITGKGCVVEMMPCTLANFSALKTCDAIIFGAPTYMGSVSARFKDMMDRSATSIWENGEWADKIAAGFTVSAHPAGDKLAVLQQLCGFAMQHKMIWVGMDAFAGVDPRHGEVAGFNGAGHWLGLGATSGTEHVLSEIELETARYFGERIARIVRERACK